MNKKEMALIFAGRQGGKSTIARLAKEAALDAGKRVVVVTPENISIQYRKKHLTAIEMLPKKEPAPLIIYDSDELT